MQSTGKPEHYDPAKDPAYKPLTPTRLRPDGVSGLLVSSLDAFRQYQRKQAWPWEHQALTRARFVTGDAMAVTGGMYQLW